MNREGPNREKIDQTRQRIDAATMEEIAPVKELPPRGELRRQTNKKSKKWKINYPIIRLLLLFFILLPITFFSIYSFKDELLLGSKKTEEEKGTYERVAIGKTKDSMSNDTSNTEEKIVEDNQVDNVIETTVAPAIEASNSGDNKNTITNQNEDPQTVSPQTGQADSTEPTTENPITTSDKTVYHTVVAGETLYRISMKYYHAKSGIVIIKQANQIKGNEIHKGQVLTIPLD